MPAQESFVLNKEIYEVPDEQHKKTLGDLVELLDVKDVLNIQVREIIVGAKDEMRIDRCPFTLAESFIFGRADHRSGRSCAKAMRDLLPNTIKNIEPRLF